MHKLYDFIEARERLTTVVVKTKLIHSPVFSEESGNEIYLKPENLQKTGSFKIRGAYNKIAKLTEEEAAILYDVNGELSASKAVVSAYTHITGRLTELVTGMMGAK